MLLLAREGVTTREFRAMHPTLADQLTERALKLREQEQEAHAAEVQYLGNHISAVIKSVGVLQRQVGALQKTVASRPSL